VAWLAGDVRLGPDFQVREEVLGDRLFKLELGWKLDEQDTELFAERFNLRDKLFKQIAAVQELALMRDGLGQFGGKAEIVRNTVAPPFPGGQPVRAVKGTVDLRRRKTRGITFKRVSFRRELFGILTWDAPAGRSYPEIRQRLLRPPAKRSSMLSSPGPAKTKNRKTKQ
jgi:hypothetical protein